MAIRHFNTPIFDVFWKNIEPLLVNRASHQTFARDWTVWTLLATACLCPLLVVVRCGVFLHKRVRRNECLVTGPHTEEDEGVRTAHVIRRTHQNKPRESITFDLLPGRHVGSLTTGIFYSGFIAQEVTGSVPFTKMRRAHSLTPNFTDLRGQLKVISSCRPCIP